MNIKEIKASKAQGHKRAEDAKNQQKSQQRNKKKGAFKVIYWWSLAGWAKGAYLTPSVTAHSSWPSISFFFFFFLTVKLPSLFSEYKCLLFLLLLCDDTLPLLVRTPAPPEPLRRVPLWDLERCPHEALPAACPVPWRVRAILLMDGLKISVTSVKVTGDTSKHRISSITTLPAHGKRGVSIVYLMACYLFTRKK